jgi:hypothetical protein
MKGKTLEGACSTHAVLPWARNRHAGLEISYKHIYQCAHASYKAARMQHAYYLGPETDTQDKTILTGKSFKARMHATRQHACSMHTTLDQKQTRRIKNLQAKPAMRARMLQGSTARMQHAYYLGPGQQHACYIQGSTHATLHQKPARMIIKCLQANPSMHACYKQGSTHATLNKKRARRIKNVHRQILQCAHACYKAARTQP